MQEKIKHHLVVILDRSGSMCSIQQQAIDSFNEQLQTARARTKEFDITVTLVSFNYDINFLRCSESIEGVKDLTLLEYSPNGGTALNDAVAITIEKVKEWVEKLEDKNADVLVCIISDGAENSSRKYPGVGNKDLAEMVQTMQEKHGWTFTYAGTNDYDLAKVAKAMNIPSSNVTAFARSEDGVRGFTDLHSLSSDMYYGTRCAQAKENPKAARISVSCFYDNTNMGLTADDLNKKTDESEEN